METKTPENEQPTWELTDAIDTLKVAGCCGVNCCCGTA
jgi:hypothetical protein